jgi:hypothetical protein
VVVYAGATILGGSTVIVGRTAIQATCGSLQRTFIQATRTHRAHINISCSLPRPFSAELVFNLLSHVNILYRDEASCPPPINLCLIALSGKDASVLALRAEMLCMTVF